MKKKKSYVRQRNLYDPSSTEPFKLSRSKLENFTRCRRCFYLDRRLGIAQPQGPPFLLNSAVDELLKKEFDRHRKDHTKHKICEQFGVDAIPLDHEKLDIWRHNFAGLETLHKLTNLLIFGAVDDIWINPEGEWIVVDYKATSKRQEITLDTKWGAGYKRQLEIYQWILKQNGEPVSTTAYILYCNNILDRDDFDNRLEFEVSMFKHEGDTSWVEPKIVEAHKCLSSDEIPKTAEDCEFCKYRAAAEQAENPKRPHT